MATYIIGDVQGCYDGLSRLLDKIHFDTASDTLWFVGDLVNRGGQSLETLRLIYSLRKNVISVLGNHDLHLIAAFYGHKMIGYNEDLLEIIRAPDSDKLIDWLRCRPLAHFDKNLLMVHAGIAPQWSVKQALKYAAEVERVLQSDEITNFLEKMYGNTPNIWRDDLKNNRRLRCIVNYFTRMRFINQDGSLDFSCSTHPSSAPQELTPWFDIPDRVAADQTIVIGHWAALMGKTKNKKVIALDTGYVWGGEMTAYHIEEKNRISVKAR